MRIQNNNQKAFGNYTFLSGTLENVAPENVAKIKAVHIDAYNALKSLTEGHNIIGGANPGKNGTIESISIFKEQEELKETGFLEKASNYTI